MTSSVNMYGEMLYERQKGLAYEHYFKALMW